MVNVMVIHMVNYLKTEVFRLTTCHHYILYHRVSGEDLTSACRWQQCLPRLIESISLMVLGGSDPEMQMALLLR